MSKKFFFLVSTVFSLSSLFAKCEQPLYHGGFTAGMNVTSALVETNYYLTFGYVNRFFSCDFGTNYAFFDTDIGDVNFLMLSSHIGPRTRLFNNLYVTYGLSGLYEIQIDVPSTDSAHYQVGSYTGLDLQLNEHFLFKSKIYPFSYEHRFSGSVLYNVFRSGSLGAEYVF